MIDRTGETCERCGKGEYAESHLSDDMGGTLHCTICADEIRRWADEPTPEDPEYPQKGQPCTAEIRATRDVLAEVVQKLRDNPGVDATMCNLLENHTNALLGETRRWQRCTVMEIPQIQTFKGVKA